MYIYIPHFLNHSELLLHIYFLNDLVQYLNRSFVSDILFISFSSLQEEEEAALKV